MHGCEVDTVAMTHFEMPILALDGREFVNEGCACVRSYNPRRRKPTSFTKFVRLVAGTLPGWDRREFDLPGALRVPSSGDVVAVWVEYKPVQLRVVDVTREGPFVHPQQVGWARLESVEGGDG